MALIRVKTRDGKSIVIHSGQIGPQPVAWVSPEQNDSFWKEVWRRFEVKMMERSR